WYPASFIPDFTIASAICLIVSSLTLQANLFQLFHPIGGVAARGAACADPIAHNAAIVTIRNLKKPIRLMIISQELRVPISTRTRVHWRSPLIAPSAMSGLSRSSHAHPAPFSHNARKKWGTRRQAERAPQASGRLREALLPGCQLCGLGSITLPAAGRPWPGRR